ncbi:hypothetical protein FRC12_010806 [Ceratobasidium sp. 428]|nr:hypothetical protein FRC12_010806 [Ceratobasidium sp. 428]
MSVGKRDWKEQANATVVHTIIDLLHYDVHMYASRRFTVKRELRQCLAAIS